jgi:hypothetical protein
MSDHGLPACPKCGGVLFEMESKQEWDGLVEKYSTENDEPLYSEFVESLREGPCKPNRDWMKLYGAFKKGNLPSAHESLTQDEGRQG